MKLLDIFVKNYNSIVAFYKKYLSDDEYENFIKTDENKKKNKLITTKMEIFNLNIFIKMENRKENKLNTMKMEMFNLIIFVKIEKKKENKLNTMKMEIFILNIFIKMEN